MDEHDINILPPMDDPNSATSIRKRMKLGHNNHKSLSIPTDAPLDGTNQALSPNSMEVELLTRTFTHACSCQQTNPSGQPCCHLNVKKIQAHLSSQQHQTQTNHSTTTTLAPKPLPLTRKFSPAPACNCIPLPDTIMATKSTLKRRRHSIHRSDSTNVDEDKASPSPTTSDDPSPMPPSSTTSNRPLMRIKKRLPKKAPSPCSSLTVEIAEGDEPPNVLSPVSSPSSDLSDLSSSEEMESPCAVVGHLATQSTFSFVETSAASTASTRSLSTSSPDHQRPPAATTATKQTSSMDDGDIDPLETDSHHPNGDSMDLVDPAALAEIRSIEDAENEGELNYLMNKMSNSNQPQAFMPYIL